MWLHDKFEELMKEEELNARPYRQSRRGRGDRGRGRGRGREGTRGEKGKPRANGPQLTDENLVAKSIVASADQQNQQTSRDTGVGVSHSASGSQAAEEGFADSQIMLPEPSVDYSHIYFPKTGQQAKKSQSEQVPARKTEPKRYSTTVKWIPAGNTVSHGVESKNTKDGAKIAPITPLTKMNARAKEFIPEALPVFESVALPVEEVQTTSTTGELKGDSALEQTKMVTETEAVSNEIYHNAKSGVVNSLEGVSKERAVAPSASGPSKPTPYQRHLQQQQQQLQQQSQQQSQQQQKAQQKVQQRLRTIHKRAEKQQRQQKAAQQHFMEQQQAMRSEELYRASIPHVPIPGKHQYSFYEPQISGPRADSQHMQPTAAYDHLTASMGSSAFDHIPAPMGSPVLHPAEVPAVNGLYNPYLASPDIGGMSPPPRQASPPLEGFFQAQDTANQSRWGIQQGVHRLPVWQGQPAMQPQNLQLV